MNVHSLAGPPPAATRAAWVGPAVHLPSFVWTLVRTDFKVRYHGSVGGFAWALARPLSVFLVLQAVFSLIFHADPDYRFNLVIGLFIWDFFVETTKAGLVSLATKGHLLTKAKLPTWLLVVASSANAFVTLALFVACIVVALIVGGRPPSPWHVAIFVAYLVQFYAIILGFSLAASVLFLRYRDLNQLWDLITQVGFFAAPIVYPLGILPVTIHFYLYLWPPTPIVQFSRDVLVAGTIPTLRAHLFLLAEAATVLALGTLIFRRYSRRVAEYL